MFAENTIEMVFFFTANLPQSENHANFEVTYSRLLVFAIHWKQVGKFSKNVFFSDLVAHSVNATGAWVLKDIIPKQLCLVWSFLHGELKKTTKLQYESATPQLFYLLVFLESGGLGGDKNLDHSNHSGLVTSRNCHRAHRGGSPWQ